MVCAECCIYTHNETGAVCPVCQTGSTVYIRITDKLWCITCNCLSIWASCWRITLWTSGALWRRWLPVSFLSCCICCCISCLTLCLFFCKSCFFFFLRLCLYKLNVEIYIIFMYPAVTLFCCYFSPVFYRFIINNNQIITNRYLCQNACICRRLCSYMKCCGINFSIFCADSFCQFFIIWYYIFTFYISVNITGLDTIPTIVSCFKDCSCGIVIQLSKYLAVRIWFWTNIYIIIYLRDCNICIFRSNNWKDCLLTSSN